MSVKIKTALVLAMTLAGVSMAHADEGHHKDEMPTGQVMEHKDTEDHNGEMMQEGGAMMGAKHHEMMQGMMNMMMQMHASMKEGRMAMDMMDRDMMALMQSAMGHSPDAGTDGSAALSGEESQQRMQSMLTMADEDGDGSLTLGEFEALHTKMMRDRMVDRFQHLDSDGDGKISGEEIAAQAKRMKMHAMQPPQEDKSAGHGH